MTEMPHQLITRAIGAKIKVMAIRDPADGITTHGVSYESAGTRWISRHRFHDVTQADAAALTLADFLGAEVRQ
jgi:hypothetical protein